jgi:hypothetical protein
MTNTDTDKRWMFTEISKETAVLFYLFILNLFNNTSNISDICNENKDDYWNLKNAEESGQSIT